VADNNVLSIEPEITVLSTILNNPDLIYNCEGLRDYMFVTTTHRNIFSIMVDIGERHSAPDISMVTNYAKSLGKLDACGGEKYIAHLESQKHTRENFTEFVGIIKNSFKLKTFANLASGVSMDTLRINSIDESISQFQTNLEKLLTDSGGEGTFALGTLLKDSFNEIVDRVNNPGSRGYSTGIKKVDTLTGGFDGGDLWYIGARPGMGKCLGAGTLVVMHDLSTKKVEDIVVGDLLMGDDSTSRRVLSTVTGISQLYYIKQNKGITYRVNGDHILSLRRSRDSVKYPKNSIINISVNDYIKKSNKFKTNYKGYKVGVYSGSGDLDLDLDPYFVGVWLGDGTASSSGITTQDSEIVMFLEEYAERLGYTLTSGKEHNNCKVYRVVGGGKSDSIQSNLRIMNLLGNKHIPMKYMSSSFSNRLLLLAGLLDTDGYYSRDFNCYEITQKNYTLAKQIKFLADSLGFKTSLHSKIATIKSTGYSCEVYRIRLSGNVWIIPVKIGRKKAHVSIKNNDWLNTGITVEKDTIGTYYGFELEGNGLFLLEDMTVTHNSAFIQGSALHNAKAGIPSLIFSKEMTRQPLMERFMSLETGIPLFDIRQGILKKPDVEVIREMVKKMSDYPMYIDLNFTGSLEQVESTIRKYISLYGIKIVYLDYIQLLSERDADQTQELGRISRKLKLLANQLDITCVVLSQLNREVEHRDNKRPVSADLRQCGNLEEDADYIIGLYRDEVYDKETKDKGKMEFIILKQRNGPTGMVKLGFDGVTTKIKED